MTIPRFMILPAVASALLAAGCGDDQKSATQPHPQASGEDAVKDTVLKWTFEGDCDLMTDKFLEDQAFIGDTRQERCDFFAKAYTKPRYKESDVKFRKVAVTGNTAVATVGSDIANVTTDYHLVATGGKWQIDSGD